MYYSITKIGSWLKDTGGHFEQTGAGLGKAQSLRMHTSRGVQVVNELSECITV